MKGKTAFLGHIESLRAIAALIVVAFHFITFQDANGPLFQNESLRSCANFGAQGVELFYIISGFVIYNSLTSRDYTIGMYPKYLQKRFLRIFPPFLGAVFLICLTPLIWKSAYPYSLNQIAQNASLTVDLFNNTSWLNPIFATLKVEFLFYLLIGLLVVLMKKNTWIYIVISGLSLISIIFFPKIELVHNVPFFVIGIACSQIYNSKEVFLNYALLMACVVFLAVLFPMEDVVIAIVCIILLLWVKIKSKWLEKIGEFSYSLYLVHGLSGGLILYFLKTQKAFSMNPWITFFISLVTAVISAYLFFRVVERKAIQWSKRID